MAVGSRPSIALGVGEARGRGKSGTYRHCQLGSRGLEGEGTVVSGQRHADKGVFGDAWTPGTRLTHGINI